jgi:hypothetical protein
MKALQDKNRVLWLVALASVLSAIAIYRIGFHIPVPGFSEEAVTSLKQGQSQEGQAQPNKTEAASSTQSPEAAFQPSHPADPRLERTNERRYRSEHPLYFRVAFRAEGGDSMLGILDESGGTGAGYDVAYLDENMNGDLTDEAAKRFSRNKQGSRAGELEPRFEFMEPFRGEERAKYTLDIYSLAHKNRKAVQGNDYYFFWFLDIKDWNYFFINGKMTLFSNAADALKGPPVRLGGRCKWEISSRTQDGKPMISAGLKDENGCTLRIVRRAGEIISPTLTLIQDGQVKAEEKMKFG